MNALTSAILWISVQIALFSLVGTVAFLLLKRRGPNTAATTAATVLTVILVLSFLAFSPWPRWSIPSGANSRSIDQDIDASPNSILGTREVASGIALQSRESTTTTTDSTLAIWWQTAIHWMQTTGEPSHDHAITSAVWHTWLPIGLLIGIALGLARLAAGMWMVGKFRRHSQPIGDAKLQENLQNLIIEFGSPAIEVRETALLHSAATIGWRRPLLLLPADWRSWTELERRVVLAHELAHVARRDYLTGLLARLTAAIHFYQPLVLWLGRQLRIQQELAADSRAAVVAGDRQTYLATLAQMALRADERPLPWAARGFLPGTSQLIKRVAWLKRRGLKVEESPNRKGKWFFAVMMAAVALAVAGIRGPSGAGTSVALAETPAEQGATPQAVGGQVMDVSPATGEQSTNNKPNQDPITVTGTLEIAKPIRTLDYIPANAKLVIAVSPSELAKYPIATRLLSAIDALGFEKTFGIKLSEVADIEFIATDPIAKQGQPVTSLASPQSGIRAKNGFNRVVFRTVKQHDWQKLLHQLIPQLETTKIAEHEYYLEKDFQKPNPLRDFGSCYYLPDDRTMVVGTEEEIQKVIRKGEQLMDRSTVFGLSSAQLAVWIDMKFVQEILNTPGMALGQMKAMFRPIIDRTKTVELMAAFYFRYPDQQKDEQMSLGLVLNCDSQDDVKQAAATLNALLTLAQNFMAAQEKQVSSMATNAVPESQRRIRMLAETSLLANAALQNTQIEAGRGTTCVHANANFPLPSDALTATSLWLSTVQASHEMATRADREVISDRVHGEAVDDGKQNSPAAPPTGPAPPPGAQRMLNSEEAAKAIVALQQALSDHPDDPKLHNDLGLELVKAGKLVEADVHYRKALALKPDFSEAHNNLGVALIKLGRRQEAIEHFREAMRLNPKFVEANENLNRANAIQQVLGKLEADAKTAAEQWLALVDAGEFAESWKTAAEPFKAAVTLEQWERQASGVRTPLGALTSRKLKSAEYRTSVPGAPDGKYVILQFDTSFANKKDAVETVTPILDKDETWRISGYYVK